MSEESIIFIDPKVDKPYEAFITHFWVHRTSCSYCEVLQEMEEGNFLSLPASRMYVYSKQKDRNGCNWRLPWDFIYNHMPEGMKEILYVVERPNDWPFLTVRDGLSGNCVTDSFPPQRIGLHKMVNYLEYKNLLTIPEHTATVCRFGDTYRKEKEYLHELNVASGDLLDVYPRVWWELAGTPYQQRLKNQYKIRFQVKMRPGLRVEAGFTEKNTTGTIPMECYGYETLQDVLDRAISEGKLNCYWHYEIQYENINIPIQDPVLNRFYRDHYLFAIDPKPGTVIPVTNYGMYEEIIPIF